MKDGNTIQLDEFEVGLGSWAQDTGDAQDFSWITEDTLTSNVGPSSGQGGSGYYLFTEASNPTNNSDDFIIYSGDLNTASYNLNLSFYWNKRGDNMGTAMIRFRIVMPATGGNYWNSDIGLDTIKVTNDGCP